MVSEPVFAALVAYAGTLTMILAGVLGWLVRRVWQIHTQEIPNIDDRMSALEQSLMGNPNDPMDDGHRGDVQDQFRSIQARFDELEQMLEENARQRKESDEQIRNTMARIATVMKEEGFNGRIPDPKDIRDDS